MEINGESTRILVEQIGGVDARRLDQLAGHLTHAELWGLDDGRVAIQGLA